MKRKRYQSYHNMVVRFFSVLLFLVIFLVLAFSGIKHQVEIARLKILGEDPFFFVLMVAAAIACAFSYLTLSLFVFNFTFFDEYIEVSYPYSWDKAKKNFVIPYASLVRVQYFGKGYDVNSVFKIVLVVNNNVKHKLVINDDAEDRQLHRFFKTLPVKLDSFVNDK